MPKVSRVAIGRLHNLGNYEHIRFDVTVELDESEGLNPGLVISKLERLLGALAPVKKEYEYERAMRVMSDPEQAKELTVEMAEIYKGRIEKHDAAIERRRAALQAFESLNGVSTHTDAKEKWEDQDDYDY